MQMFKNNVCLAEYFCECLEPFLVAERSRRWGTRPRCRKNGLRRVKKKKNPVAELRIDPLIHSQEPALFKPSPPRNSPQILFGKINPESERS